ncbi:Wzz/FepE/Etk N-terminal domain-containing protein [Cohnella panacarvi]|uniref:Wzz/FepE/Etk N-terminal domain-containing protein n=1 Tax=Cohnella panacarvi TaxID=400776 RepID=UPI00047C4498|nr:Wzz/FepE/Etk N-terminal domain-containing protein [Cohnella panacarvi]
MEKEISLRDVIEVIIKQKWTIIIVTFASILIAASLSLFVLSPKYETFSIVNIQSNSQDETIKTKFFTESIKSSVVLNALIEKNELKNIYTVTSLRKMFSLETTPDNSYIKLIVHGESPERITQISNMLAYELGILIETDDRSLIIGAAQKRLKELEKEIAIAKTKLSESQVQLEKIPAVQREKQVLSNNELLRSVLQESANTDVKSSASLQMESEVINPAYTDMQKVVAEASIALNLLLSEEEVLKQKVIENTSRVQEIQNKLASEKLSGNKTIRILDEMNVITISPSIKPKVPVGPNIVLSVILAAVLGAMLSLVFVFLRNYLKGTPRSVKDE